MLGFVSPNLLASLFKIQYSATYSLALILSVCAKIWSMPAVFKKATGLVLIVGLVLLISYWIQSDDQQEALSTARDWCQLAAYPPFQVPAQIQVNGGRFTRTFEITLQMQPDLIAKWITASPGLNLAKPEQQADRLHYLINSSRAAHCEIDILGNQVQIKTYWS